MTSLYPSIMRGKLPFQNYKHIVGLQALARIMRRVTEKAEAHDISQDNVGYLVRCSYHLEPERVIDAYVQYSPIVSREIVTETMKSEHQRSGRSDKTPKILQHLMPVTGQWVDGERLQLLLEVGAKIDAVYEAVSYEQTDFLAPFVSSCVRRRHAAKNDACLAAFQKATMNTLFGNHCHRKRNLTTFKFKHKYEDVQRNDVPRDHFDGCDLMRDVFMMTSSKRDVVLDSPMLVGSAILERSKVRMMRAFYDLCKGYPEGAVKLIISDTDSFIVSIKTDDYYQDLTLPGHAAWRKHLDLSSYEKFPDWRASLAKPPCFAGDALAESLGTTEMVPGYLKDELLAKKAPVAYMTEVVGLRSKVYSYDEEVNGVIGLGAARCKGVSLKQFMVRRPLTALYRDVLSGKADAPKFVGTAIRCSDFRLHTIPIVKCSVSAHDDKYYLDADGEKWPYGCVQNTGAGI
jgi:hypothetical protein